MINIEKRICILITFVLLITPIFSSVSACIVLNASMNGFVYAGSNMDWTLNNTCVWFVPSDEDTFGCVFVGFDDFFPQGGLNERGLFYDCTLCPFLEVLNSSDKPRFHGFLPEFCLKTCTTVQDVLDVYDDYNLEGMETYQVMFIDKYGNSVIIEGDKIIRKNDYYQVITNFYQSHPELGWYPCWRYDQAIEMFEQCDDISVDLFKLILDATHQGWPCPTQYSWICDLKNGLLYLYSYHNFDNVAMFNVTEELKQGYHWYSIASLFNVSSQPDKPSLPLGPRIGSSRRNVSYSCVAMDPDGDEIYYLFDWGDGFDSGWLGPYASGEEVFAVHRWSKSGFYEVKVRVKDVHGHMSNWSDPLAVSMPKNLAFENIIFFRFINYLKSYFPFMQLIFNNMEV